jgi:hypothetical protein
LEVLIRRKCGTCHARAAEAAFLPQPHALNHCGKNQGHPRDAISSLGRQGRAMSLHLGGQSASCTP